MLSGRTGGTASAGDRGERGSDRRQTSALTPMECRRQVKGELQQTIPWALIKISLKFRQENAARSD